jgi:hypothetical protein
MSLLESTKKVVEQVIMPVNGASMGLFVVLIVLAALGVFLIWFARRPLSHKIDDKPPWAS